MKLSTKQELLANAIIEYIAGASSDAILEVISEDQWENLNSKYRFSSDSYDMDNDENLIVLEEFPKL